MCVSVRAYTVCVCAVREIYPLTVWALPIALGIEAHVQCIAVEGESKHILHRVHHIAIKVVAPLEPAARSSEEVDAVWSWGEVVALGRADDFRAPQSARQLVVISINQACFVQHIVYNKIGCACQLRAQYVMQIDVRGSRGLTVCPVVDDAHAHEGRAINR